MRTPFSAWVLQGKSKPKWLKQMRRGEGEPRPHCTSRSSLERTPDKAAAAQLWSWLERKARR